MAALIGGTIGTVCVVVGIIFFAGALAASWDERNNNKKDK